MESGNILLRGSYPICFEREFLPTSCDADVHRLAPCRLSQPLVRELFPVYRQVREYIAQVGIRYRSVTARPLRKVSIPFRLSPGCKLYYFAHGTSPCQIVGTSNDGHRFPGPVDAAGLALLFAPVWRSIRHGAE